MNIKIFLILMSFFMATTVYSDSSVSSGNNYVKIHTLSGIEADAIRIAVEKFKSEKINTSMHNYEILLYLKNNDYLVIFERAKNVAYDAIAPTYEVVISSKTFEIIHFQFSR